MMSIAWLVVDFIAMIVMQPVRHWHIFLKNSIFIIF